MTAQSNYSMYQNQSASLVIEKITHLLANCVLRKHFTSQVCDSLVKGDTHETKIIPSSIIDLFRAIPNATADNAVIVNNRNLLES